MITKIVPVVLIAVILSIFATTGCIGATPVVEIQPDLTIVYGESVYVNGTGFDVNETVRIDVTFPSGTVIEGVETGETDANGTFSIMVEFPDVDGDGYIKVVCGTDIISELVSFKGTIEYNLTVNVPEEVVVNEVSNFTVSETSLSDEHYIIVAKTISPTVKIQNTYWVLHDGSCVIPFVFDEIGTYTLNISVEDMKYSWGQYIAVTEKSDDATTSGSLNITWNTVRSEDTYTVNLLKEGSGYVQSGTIRIVRPDGSMVDATISSGSARFTVDEKGTYQMQYTEEDMLFLQSVEYSPSATLTASGFTKDGTTTLTFMVDGKAPSDAVTATVTSDTIQNTVTLSNGFGSFSTLSVGTYSFTVNYKGVTASSSASYSDTYQVEDFRVVQSEDTGYIFVTGKVVGVNSGEGKSNARVDITIDEIGYSDQVKTSDSGIFRETIPLSSGDKGGFFGGALVNVEYEYGDDVSTSSLVLDRDVMGEYWLLWTFVAIILFLLAKEKGYIYKYFKMFPPKGEQKGSQDGAFDESFF